MTHFTLVFLFTLLLLPGLFMACIPMLPAFWYLLAGASVFALIDGFSHLTLSNLGILASLFTLSILVDWSAGLLGAKMGGAGWKSLLWGTLGSLIGLFIVPPFGVFAGLFIGVLVSELWRKRDQQKALRAASGALIGSLVGVTINVALACIFVMSFVLLSLS